MKFVIWVIVIILICYLIAKRNQFEKLRRAVKHEGSNIGIYMAKRTACLNDALGIAKVSYRHEVDGIERLTAKDQLDHLAYLGQKYPGLQSVQGYNETLQRAFKLNEDIAASQALMNGNINEYNDAISSFPGLLVAKLFRYKSEKFIDEENIESNKKLDKRQVNFSDF